MQWRGGGAGRPAGPPTRITSVNARDRDRGERSRWTPFRQRLGCVRVRYAPPACGGSFGAHSSRALHGAPEPPDVRAGRCGHEPRAVSSVREAPAGTALGEPGAVAVDHDSGEVFLAEPARGVVDVLDSSGAYVGQFGEGVLEAQSIAVDEATGDVYVSEAFADAILVFKPNGAGGYGLLSEWSGASTPTGAFGQVAGVAVENCRSCSWAGDVFVVDREVPGGERGAVDLFAPKPEGAEEAEEGAYVGALKGVKLIEPNGVAINGATGQVYVADSVRGAIYSFSPSGGFEGKLTGKGSPMGTFSGGEEEEGNVAAVAVDETTGDLLVVESERRVVGELGSSGEWLGWVTGTPAGGFSEGLSVAVGSSGDLYVADAGAGVLDIFGPGLTVPDVATKPAIEVKGTTAVELKGVVEGEGTRKANR